MLSYALSRGLARPLYDQLYHCLRRDIENGRLREGERLPGRKALAAQLGVSKITVDTAYQQLAAEGYIRAKMRSGCYVEGVPAPIKAPAPEPPAPVPRAHGEGYPVDFVKNALDSALFPHSVWARLTRAAILDAGDDLLAPQPFAGLYALRSAICAYLARMKGIQACPEQVILGAGSEYLFNMLIQFLGRARACAVESPGYPLTGKILEKNQIACVPVPMDAHGVRPDALYKSGAGALALSPSHQFPTGHVTPIGRRREILAWAGEGDRYIIENDYDSEFRFTGLPIPAITGIDTGGRAIYMNTFSKSIAPGVRVSYMVLPKPFAARYAEEMSFYTCTAPTLEQYVLERFLSLGHFDRHIARMKRAYRIKRDCVISLLRESALASRAAILEADAGLHFLLRVDTRETDAALKWALRRAGVRIACLSDYEYIPGSVERHVLVVNYSGVDTTALARAMPRIERALGAK